jgi:hypothetical protein
MQNPIATTVLSCSLVLLSDSSPHLANENLIRGARTIDRVTRDIVQNKNSVASRATRLIIVAGHSVLVSGNVQNAAFDDSVWFLYGYQRGRGLPHAIVSHIRAGICLALDDPRGLLVFSGGKTRARTGPETKGGSYFRVADALDLWDGRDVFASDGNDAGVAAAAASCRAAVANSTIRARAVSKEYATNSLENLMFLVCRFRKVTGRYPERVSVVSMGGSS